MEAGVTGPGEREGHSEPDVELGTQQSYNECYNECYTRLVL